MAWRLVMNIRAATAAATTLATTLSGIGDSGLPTGATPIDDTAAKRAELNIIELDEAAAKIGQDVDKHKELITAEEAVATKIGDHVTDLQNALTASNDQLQEMRNAAGLGDESGVGAEKKKLTDDLNEARARLQYLEDTNAGADAIAAQKKAADDLTAQLTDAEKRFRVADYELSHSDAWQKQLQAIADQQALIKDEQQKQAEEQKHLDDMKADLAAREAEAQKLADERAAQQAIIDKQQQDAQAQALALRKAELQKELGDLTAATAAHVGIIRSAAAEATQQVQDAVTQGATQLVDTAAQVSQTIATTAATAVADAGKAIEEQMSAALKSLLDLVAGPPESANSFGDATKDKEYGSQFAGQFRDDQGNVSGGAISDPTYAAYVQAYIASKKRYEADNAPGMQQYQGREVQGQMELEQLWQQLGGEARFNATLDQIYRKLNDQSSAIAGINKAVNVPRPRPSLSSGRVALYLPKVAPRPDPNKNLIAILIRTGQL
jgi:hypothetical protein